MKANLINLCYHPLKKKMISKEGIPDKAICWPEYRLGIEDLLKELKSNRKLPLEPFKFIRNSTESYLDEIEVNLTKCDFPTGASLLHFAAGRDCSQYLQCIVHKFENKNLIDRKGFTPLHYSCKMGLWENARVLLESGADANIAANDGTTCLMLLAKRKKHDPKLVKLLLKYNASCEAENNESMRALDIARNVDKNSPIIKLIHPMFSQI